VIVEIVATLIAQAQGVETISLPGWWDITQKAGAGAAVVLGPVIFYLWKAYQGETKYSKERDTQTLTVMLTLTKLIEDLNRKEDTASEKQEVMKVELLKAIGGLEAIIREHWRK